MRCTLLNGPAWSTEKKYMRRYKGVFDIFFGVELRMRKEEMEEQFNKEAKEGWSSTDVNASSGNCEHALVGVLGATDSDL